MILFYLLSAAIVLSALVVVGHRNPVYCALGLMNTLFLQAMLFALLDAHLLVWLQLMIYAGAIVVLFLFVIMLLSLTPDEQPTGGIGMRAAAGIGGLLLATELSAVAALSPGTVPGAAPLGFGEVRGFARLLFTRYLLPFELTSVLLLVAVVGAVVMARRKA